MLYIYNGLMFSLYEASRKLPILLTIVSADDRYLELRMRYEDSRKKLLGIIAEKGVTTEDREKLMLVVSKAFDKLFLDIAEDNYRVYMDVGDEELNKLMDTQKIKLDASKHDTNEETLGAYLYTA